MKLSFHTGSVGDLKNENIACWLYDVTYWVLRPYGPKSQNTSHT